jgi:hypothetical protein
MKLHGGLSLEGLDNLSGGHGTNSEPEKLSHLRLNFSRLKTLVYPNDG